MGGAFGKVSGTSERRKEWIGPTAEPRTGWPIGIYSSALRPVPETFPRAWPSSWMLGGHSRPVLGS